jgi:hypothetical protein
VGEVYKYYKSDLRASETITTAKPTDRSWDLSVNYEDTLRNISDTVS